jgi:hypothetical protein
MCDSTQEWFPAISKRSSLTTVQGKEWIDGNQFVYEKENYSNLQSCAMNYDETCINKYVRSAFDYIFLMKTTKIRNCIPQTTLYSTDGLQQSLHISGKWSMVYENEDTIIYIRR